MQQFVSKVMNFRKQSEAIRRGKTIHFAPENKIYVLFKAQDNETVVCILHRNDEPVELDLNRFTEMNLDGKTFKNVITGDSVLWNGSLTLNNKGVTLLTNTN